MSAQEIIAELPKLSAKEREMILSELVSLERHLSLPLRWKKRFGRASARFVKKERTPPPNCVPALSSGLRGSL